MASWGADPSASSDAIASELSDAVAHGVRNVSARNVAVACAEEAGGIACSRATALRGEISSLLLGSVERAIAARQGGTNAPQGGQDRAAAERSQVQHQVRGCLEQAAATAAHQAARRHMQAVGSVATALVADVERCSQQRTQGAQAAARDVMEQVSSCASARGTQREVVASLSQALAQDLTLCVERLTASKRRGAARAATAVVGRLTHAAVGEERPQSSLQKFVKDELEWEVERSILLHSAGLATSTADLANLDGASLLQPPDWQRAGATPRDLMSRERPLSLPPSRVQSPLPPQSPLPEIGTPKLGSTQKLLPPVAGVSSTMRLKTPPLVDDIFSTPLKALEHKSGRVPNISPVRPAAGLLSGMPRVRTSKVSMFCGYYRSWESQASLCEDGPTRFDRDRIYEHAHRCVKRIRPGAPFQEAPPYVAPWEDPMENVDMSIKSLELIMSDGPTEEVEPKDDLMPEKLPGWAFPKRTPPVLGAYAHGAAIDSRGF